jgi:hypothetical protein
MQNSEQLPFQKNSMVSIFDTPMGYWYVRIDTR